MIKNKTVTTDQIKTLNELDIILENMSDAEFNEITSKVKNMNVNKNKIMNETKNWKCYSYKGVEYFKNTTTGEKKTAGEMVDFSLNQLNEIRRNSAAMIAISCKLRKDQIDFFEKNSHLIRNEVIRETLDEFIKNYKMF